MAVSVPIQRPSLIGDGDVELTPLTRAGVDRLLRLPNWREIAWEYGWEQRPSVEFAELLATTWERGLAFFAVHDAGRWYGVAWAVPYSGWAAVSGFELGHRQYGFWERPETMAVAVRLTIEWSAKTLGTSAAMMIPCRDRRFIKWARAYELPSIGSFRDRHYIAALGA